MEKRVTSQRADLFIGVRQTMDMFTDHTDALNPVLLYDIFYPFQFLSHNATKGEDDL